MRSLPLILLAASVVSGCTRAPEPGALLAAELAGYVAGAPQGCIGTFANQNLRVIDARTIAYGWGPTTYVNRLAADCPALSPHNSIIVEAQSGQYCRGDRVRGLEPGAIIAGPSCNLSDWIPYRMR